MICATVVNAQTDSFQLVIVSKSNAIHNSHSLYRSLTEFSRSVTGIKYFCVSCVLYRYRFMSSVPAISSEAV